jgi:hypothetical protein
VEKAGEFYEVAAESAKPVPMRWGEKMNADFFFVLLLNCQLLTPGGLDSEFRLLDSVTKGGAVFFGPMGNKGEYPDAARVDSEILRVASSAQKINMQSSSIGNYIEVLWLNVSERAS